MVHRRGVRRTDKRLQPDPAAPGKRFVSVGATSGLGQWNSLARNNPGLLAGVANQVLKRSLLLLSGTSVSAPVVSAATALQQRCCCRPTRA